MNAIHRKDQREKFKTTHEGELRQFYMTRRKLKDHFTPEGKLPLTKWRTERGKLQQAYQEDYDKHQPHPGRLDEAVPGEVRGGHRSPPAGADAVPGQGCGAVNRKILSIFQQK